MKVLVFDVETTGLLPKNACSIDECPHIVQLSFAVYDITSRTIIHSYDTYVKIADDVEISEKAEEITGINKQTLKKKGKDIVTALKKLHSAYNYCDVVVGHNITFDKKMIIIEMKRNEEQLKDKCPEVLRLFDIEYEKAKHIQSYCTMMNGIDICNIEVPSKYPDKKSRKKWPKLSELYDKLFAKENIEGLHNSMVDVLVCLKCYLKMKHDMVDRSIKI